MYQKYFNQFKIITMPIYSSVITLAIKSNSIRSVILIYYTAVYFRPVNTSYCSAFYSQFNMANRRCKNSPDFLIIKRQTNMNLHIVINVKIGNQNKRP